MCILEKVQLNHYGLYPLRGSNRTWQYCPPLQPGHPHYTVAIHNLFDTLSTGQAPRGPIMGDLQVQKGPLLHCYLALQVDCLRRPIRQGCPRGRIGWHLTTAPIYTHSPYISLWLSYTAIYGPAYQCLSFAVGDFANGPGISPSAIAH